MNQSQMPFKWCGARIAFIVQTIGMEINQCLLAKCVCVARAYSRKISVVMARGEANDGDIGSDR